MMLDCIPPQHIGNNGTIMPSLRLKSFVLPLVLVQQRANICFPEEAGNLTNEPVERGALERCSKDLQPSPANCWAFSY